MAATIYDIDLTSPTGKDVSLNEYKNKVLLIVNVASLCGSTPQYEGLQKLNNIYRDRGLRVLGLPSNDFGEQEPGTMEEIQQFCSINYGVTFDLFAKVHTIGEEQHPLYQWLTNHAELQGDVKWNFEKFLVSREGVILDRFSSKVTPEDADLIAKIEQAL